MHLCSVQPQNKMESLISHKLTYIFHTILYSVDILVYYELYFLTDGPSFLLLLSLTDFYGERM